MTIAITAASAAAITGTGFRRTEPVAAAVASLTGSGTPARTLAATAAPLSAMPEAAAAAFPRAGSDARTFSRPVESWLLSRVSR